MKKVLVLLGSVLVAGCFICRKTVPQQEKPIVPEVVQQPQPPVQEPVVPEPVITRYSLQSVANFAFDSKVIRPEANKMDELERDIEANPQALILVEGHTDNIGPEEYNKRLSLARAESVAAVLKEHGHPNEIRTEGMGFSAPIASNDTAAGRAQNRRVDVVIVRNEK